MYFPKLNRLSLLITLSAISVSAFSASLNEQRNLYKQTLTQLKNKNYGTQIQNNIKSLRNYPLYPYLQVIYLSDNLSITPTRDLVPFINTYADIGSVKTLRKNAVNQATNQQDWRFITEVLKPGLGSTDEQCQYYYAQYKLKNNDLAFGGAEDIWLTGTDLPNACEPIIAIWKENDRINEYSELLRLELAIRAKNYNIAKYIMRELPSRNNQLVTETTKLLDDPTYLRRFAQNMPVSGFSHSVINTIFPRLVNENVVIAQRDLPSIISAQKIKAADARNLERSIASYLIRDSVTPAQAAWRDDFIVRTHDEQLIEKSIRRELATAFNKNTFKKWYNALPRSAQQKDEWKYWNARILLSEGKINEGKAQLKSLVNSRGFYPMLAAQESNVKYPYHEIKKVSSITKKQESQLNKMPGIQRVHELLYLNSYPQALQEWLNILKGRSPEQLEVLARYALDRDWGAFSIQATIYGQLWDHFEERLPIVYEKEFDAALNGKEITKSFAMAIARQESAFHPEIGSPVGASGLMQIMPATAKETADKIKLSYSGASQLIDPKTNIEIGTAYLDSVYKRFGDNRILASAAYNAGPGRVNQWLKKTNGTLDVAMFVESIPFNETRGYVKNVLMYDYLYRHILKENTSKFLTTEEYNRKY